MTFWSSQTLESRLDELVSSQKPAKVDCNSIELTVGREVYVTPNFDDAYTATKRQLGEEQSFQIPPGQFAFLLTEETVKVPTSAMAFISMKATFKMKGLINVSGFHVDPGWEGPLVFAVFNAGPAPVHLQRGLALFLIWYANLDEASVRHKSVPGGQNIAPGLINNLGGGIDTLNSLDLRLKDGIKKLDERINEINNTHSKTTVTLTVISTILIGLIGYILKENLPSLLIIKSQPPVVIVNTPTLDVDIASQSTEPVK